MGPIRRVMDSPCLSAAGIRFLDHPVPAGGSAFLAVGSLLGIVERRHFADHDGIAAFHMMEMRSGWVLSMRRDPGVCSGANGTPRHRTLLALPPTGSWSTDQCRIIHLSAFHLPHDALR